MSDKEPICHEPQQSAYWGDFVNFSERNYPYFVPGMVRNGVLQFSFHFLLVNSHVFHNFSWVLIYSIATMHKFLF